MTAIETRSDARQFLTFRLADQEYGVGILCVQEIRGWSAVTAIPQAPAWLLGVVNLRGSVVPVVDLRIKLGLVRADYDEHTVIIVLNVGTRVVGIVVDGVSDVVTLSGEEIRPAPPLGGGADTRHILGFGLGEHLRILMDVERLLAGADLAGHDAVH